MERISILIDGANFYHLVLKKLHIEETLFDFDAFAVFLANGRKIPTMGKRYYVGTVREKEGDERSKQAMSRQTSLFTTLKKANWEIKTSKLRTRVEEIPIDSRVTDYKKIQKLGIKSIRVERQREKGVDVKLATDIIVGAVDDQYDTAVIISSDSDLIPAIDWIRLRKHKKVEYVGFSIPDEKNPEKSTNPIISLITRTDIKRILVEADIRRFVRPTLIDAIEKK